mgnify:CR=1 FL=1
MKKVNQVKTKKQLEKRLKELSQRFDREIHTNMVESVNSFLEHNETLNTYDVTSGVYEKFTDSVCLSGAWTADRLRGYVGTTHNSTYKKSLSKKIRNALGYTF